MKSIPSEARCKRIVWRLLTSSDVCLQCSGVLAFKRSTTYGWCGICRVKVRPKAHCWLKGAKLTYQEVFLLLTCWQSRMSPGAAKASTNLSYTTIHRWYERFREHLPPDSRQDTLDGIVEVDESWFGRRNHGSQQIVVGAIERGSGRLKLEIVTDTAQDTLEQFIVTHITPNSLLVTDAHMGYSGIEWLGYGQEIWNHSVGHFAGTNHIEATWSAMKRQLRRLYNHVATSSLQQFIQEWMARHNQKHLFESPQRYLKGALVPL